MATQRRSSVLRFQLEGVEGPGVEIGRGSYAVVEEYDFLGLSCVGKCIHKELYANASIRERETMLERFEGECEMLSRLRHPHIVQFLGVHFNKGSPVPVLLMERLHSTLAACVDRHGKLPDECCYSVLCDVGVGLRYLHGHTPNPIVHRDLTANNVLLMPDLTAKISDLGVAKILNLNPAHMTRMTKCPGTPSYMPPEALVERPIYSTKMDMFSYGNLMTHVFSGRWPIPAEIFRANPSNPHDMTALTEVQRREAYLNDIGDTHPLMGLMRECLSNNPTLRPNIPEALRRVKEVVPLFPPSFENRAEVLQRIQADATARVSLNAQVSYLSAQVEQKEDELRTVRYENATLDDQRRDLLTQIEQKEGQLRALTNVTLNDQVRDPEGELRKLSDEKADQFSSFSTLIEQKEGQLRSLSAQLEQLQKRTVEETETLNTTHGIEVERLSVSLDELRAEAEGLRAAVRAKEERLSAREQEIEATQEIVKVRDLAVASKEQQRKEEVAAKEQEIEAARAILKAREQELASKDLAVAAKEQQRKKEVAAKDQEIEATMKARDLAVAAKEQELEAARAVIKAREQELASKDLAVTAKEQQRKEEIEAAQAIIRSKEEELALNSQVVATIEQQRKQEVEANSRLLNAKDRDISSLHMEVASKDVTLQAKDFTIASLRSQATCVETLLQRIQTLADENAALNRKMASLIVDSVSMKPIPGQILESQLLDPQCKPKWRRGADLPVAMFSPHLVKIRNNIYCGGGHTGNEDTARLVFKYYPTVDTWSLLPPCPTRHHGLSEFDNALVSVGGVMHNAPLLTATNSVYKFQDPNWVTSLPPMPTARFDPSVFSHKTHLIACGGVTSWTSCKQFTCTTTVEMLNSETGQWSTLAPLLFALRLMSIAVSNGRCYLIGGENKEGNTQIACSAPLPLLIESASQPSPSSAMWEVLPNCPLRGSTAAELGGCVLTLGGKIQGVISTDVYLYSLTSKSWRRTTAVNLPIASYWTTSAALAGDSIVVVGGREISKKRLNTVFIATFGNMSNQE